MKFFKQLGECVKHFSGSLGSKACRVKLMKMIINMIKPFVRKFTFFWMESQKTESLNFMVSL